MQQDQRKKNPTDMDFFTEYGDANRYKIQEVIGKGSYGVVCSATDMHTGDKVAIKKIHDIFEHISDAARILREIKLLRLLRHPDIVEIKHIMLPPSRRDFKDIYVVFELMESDLHQVIKANDDLTREHYQFFLYQLLRALKYIHTGCLAAANVYHRDLKPKNILANANCKLKICDFGLARVAFNDTPTTIFGRIMLLRGGIELQSCVDHFFRRKEYSTLLQVEISCRSVMASELQYTPAIDIWSIGCIFAEVLTGKPLFPGKNVVHQLDLMTDLLGTPPLDTISRVRNEKARRYLTSMRKKQPVPFAQKFPNADPLALRLLEKLLAFDPKDRPTAEEALADPYFKGLARVEREPSCQPITKIEFEFERRRVTKEDIRELIFREILEYHPQLLKDYISGTERTNFLAVDQFKKQFAHLEENGGLQLFIQIQSLPRNSQIWLHLKIGKLHKRHATPEIDGISGTLSRTLQAHQRIPLAKPGKVVGPVGSYDNGSSVKDPYDARMLIRNAVLPPQAVPPTYCFRRNSMVKQETSGSEAEKDLPQTKTQPPQYNMVSKLAPDIAIDINTNPFYLSRVGVAKADQVDDRIAIDANLLQAKSQFGGMGSAAAAHRKVGTVQFGMSRMY
ncbi:hypothetical protein HHK36_032735 [Tetracentron sinense]|uniref:mitogen-activated protein kinase n=1 Tax=Tetracentron sinense TaxID=13715 RepID=A0A834Y8L8_TETSI|nr:hypothetical protein HHK36_032735 [Tetracentron sinense]